MKTQRSEGYIESLSALALQYTISVYLHEWNYFYNALAVYVGALFLSRNIASKYAVCGAFALYFLLVCQSQLACALHLVCFWLLNSVGLSFCDRIILAQLLNNYCWTGLQKLIHQQVFASQMISNDT